MPSVLPPETDRDVKLFKVPLEVIGLRDISCGHTTKFCPRDRDFSYQEITCK